MGWIFDSTPIRLFVEHSAANPLGSVTLMGLFPTYAYQFRSSLYPIGSVCRKRPSTGEYIRTL
ncbi:hypothetical protein BKK81_01970 [Cupriavidus sp. USMAHM13]|nr:hypothetical protein BKK81_01970 [Cupriavidus sp. USMAHM13]